MYFLLCDQYSKSCVQCTKIIIKECELWCKLENKGHLMPLHKKLLYFVLELFSVFYCCFQPRYFFFFFWFILFRHMYSQFSIRSHSSLRLGSQMSRWDKWRDKWLFIWVLCVLVYLPQEVFTLNTCLRFFAKSTSKS